MPEDYVPYWDFNILVSDTTKDSSAASIAPSALLALARLVKDKTVTMRYERIASKILNSLTKNYLTKDKNEPGILMHGCFDKPRDLGVDNCTIFSDYYYLEGLAKEENRLFRRQQIQHKVF